MIEKIDEFDALPRSPGQPVLNHLEQNGMPAEIEEVVVHRDFGDAQNLAPYLGYDTCDFALRWPLTGRGIHATPPIDSPVRRLMRSSADHPD
ncbi:hypothetical protein [Streptomyces alkaliterrae]|uniref:hypothetical protein n=1 Tax=Streptomyces alkaliterrae TaxID=2213162 RepID=UPI001E5151D1|nr:hypothetical protein [Streptomyces alkaliterrae]